MAGFEAGVRQRDGTAVVVLRGVLNAEADQAITEAYTQAAAAKPSTILLTFDGVEYINSTGIALIVGILAQARKDGRAITACGLAEHYREIFEITRLADFMQIYPDERAALAGK